MRLTNRQQDRCHVFSDEKSNKTRGKSHCFELSRTLSCERATKEFSRKKAQNYKRLMELEAPNPSTVCLRKIFCAFVANDEQ